MSDGKTHAYFHKKLWYIDFFSSVFILIVFFFLNLSVFQIFLFVISNVVFYLIGENFVSPDNDLISLSSGEGVAITFGKKISEKIHIPIVSQMLGFFIGIFPFLFFQHSSFYAYCMQFFGGHRGFSHVPIVGTISRMIWFDVPIGIILYFWYTIGMTNWGWNNFWYYMYLDIWLYPVLFGQFLAWTIGDFIHFILDTKWFKKYYKH